VLDGRESPIVIFAFSELTPLVNIVAAHPMGRGIYSMGPVFLGYGLKRFARLHAHVVNTTPSPSSTRGSDSSPGVGDAPSSGRLEVELPRRFREFFGWVVEIMEQRAEPIAFRARVVRGSLPDRFEASFIGGNLTVFCTMIGSRYAEAVDPAGNWILIEDYNDKPERFDRYLAHLTLAGFWDRCAGILLGDFHQEDRDLAPAIVEMLKYHLPCGCRAPILITDEIGHTWPMTPIPLHVPLAGRQVAEREFSLTWTPAQIFQSNSPASSTCR
jgi:hypothetical protein